ADPARIERWRRELGGEGFKVGIAWQGSPSFPGDRLRSIPLAHFAPLAGVEGVRLFSLQKGPGREQIRSTARVFASAGRLALTDLGERLDEQGAFLDTAAVMKTLDLVITSDTAIAHLAGALGVPVWVALSIGPDWRWLLDREDCPWYPTMRLFRQRRQGDWDEVFERMAAELHARNAGSCVTPVGQASSLPDAKAGWEPAARATVAVPVAAGELIDKITILEIKEERVADSLKLRNIREELAALRQARHQALPATPELAELTARLRAVNETLWQIEDDIRLC